MKVLQTDIPEILLLEPRVFEDVRGAFWESHNRRTFAQATGIDVEFVQDNHSRSRQNVLRGLHYQLNRPQGKLIRVVRGEIFDVAVDLRRSSPTFKRWVGFRLSERTAEMVWIPPGFAHGFYAITDAEMLYKMTDFYAPQDEHTLIWNDPDVGVPWPCASPRLSDKDAAGKRLAEVDLFP